MSSKQFLSDITSRMPVRKLSLPVYGFEDRTFHVVVTLPSATYIWKRISKINISTFLFNMAMGNILSWGVMLRMGQIIFGLNFYGLQQMRYQGLTEYVDNRLASTTSALKYILNPNEYVMWNMPVHSMTDGVVVAINNNKMDAISRSSYENIGLDTPIEELYGNNIIIELNKIRYCYCGLKRNSMIKYSIGDKVNSGDIIGKVGCSGLMSKSPFLHVEARLAYSVPGIFENMYFPIPMLKFEPFYQFRLFNEVRKSAESVDRIYVKDIQYIYNAGSLMSDATLIRKATNF